MVYFIQDYRLWLGFSLFLIVALSLDRFYLNKHHANPSASLRAAVIWSLVWITSALIFNGLIWLYLASNANTHIANEIAIDFFTGYLIEKMLAVDNLFAFYMIFTHFRIPLMYQARVFSYGVIGAIIMRLILILFGAWAIDRFHWLLYIMGAFLILTGIKMATTSEKNKDLAETTLIKFVEKIFRVSHTLQDEHFFVKQKGLWYITPLFMALIFIEMSDLVFAFDSIPAIFAITRDPFIVWTSNIFAILGLRALYFVIIGMIDRFQLLKYGMALIMVFVGAKMVIEPWIYLSSLVSLIVIITILIVFAVASTLHQRVQKGK